MSVSAGQSACEGLRAVRAAIEVTLGRPE